MPRPNSPPHMDKAKTLRTFTAAYERLVANGPLVSETDRGTPFKAVAHVAKRGNHIGEKCIRIFSNGTDRGPYIYKCCWGHVTNCYSTYIDVYTRKL